MNDDDFILLPSKTIKALGQFRKHSEVEGIDVPIFLERFRKPSFLEKSLLKYHIKLLYYSLYVA